MSNQPEHGQGSSRDNPLASAAQDVPGQAPVSPEDQQQPDVAHEQHETSRGAGARFISTVRSCFICGLNCLKCSCSPEGTEPVNETVESIADSSGVQPMRQMSQSTETSGSTGHVYSGSTDDVEDIHWDKKIKLVHHTQPTLTRDDGRNTHYLSNFITRVQCFLVPTDTSIKQRCSSKAKEIEKVLGIRVQSMRTKCNRADCQPCFECEVCPHRYFCNCSDTYKQNGWCAHIHTMHMLPKAKFQKKVYLYIQTDVRYTLMRHIRGFLRGEYFMVHLADYDVDTYKEVDGIISLEGKVIRVQDRKNKCTCAEHAKCTKCFFCRCLYTCSCPDYLVDKQLCQHIHNVNMPKLTKSNGRFEFFAIDVPKLKLSYSLSVMQDPNVKYYVNLEHEMSFYIDFVNIKRQRSIPPPHLVVDNSKEFSKLYFIKPDNSDPDSALHDVPTVDSSSQISSESDSEINVQNVTPELDARNVVSGSEVSSAIFDVDEDVKDSWWIVYQKSGAKECSVRYHILSNKKCPCKSEEHPTETNCTRCGICFRHYTCDCPLDATIICRHVHAIHRMINNSTETPQEAKKFVKENLQLPASQASLSYLEWGTHAGKVDVSQAGQEMDVLPIPAGIVDVSQAGQEMDVLPIPAGIVDASHAGQGMDVLPRPTD